VSTLPTVSIVMPTYERLEFLRPAVESVFAQTFRDWELVIADDGSGGPVLDYLRSLEQRDGVRVLRLEHSGNPGKARNAAIAAVRAPLVAIMDSDDLWAPVKLEKQVAAVRKHSDCGWSYTGYVLVDADDVALPSERNRRWIPHAGDIFAEVVRTIASIPTSGVIATAELVQKVGGFDEAMTCSEDYDLWARFALESRAAVVAEPLVRVRRHRLGEHQPLGLPHAARDYSLRKLTGQVDGGRRALVVAERARNALGLATVYAAHGKRRRALSTVAQGAKLGWRSPRWWAGAAKASARACFGTPRASGVSASGVEARLERVDQE
jgi:hypothetical protein